jgi:hypothetical protein
MPAVCVLSPEDVARLQAAMPAHLAAAVTVAFWAGLRLGEVLGLQVGDIDLAKEAAAISSRTLWTADNVFASHVGFFAHCSKRPRVFRRASSRISSTSAMTPRTRQASQQELDKRMRLFRCPATSAPTESGRSTLLSLEDIDANPYWGHDNQCTPATHPLAEASPPYYCRSAEGVGFEPTMRRKPHSGFQARQDAPQ